jgi:hypothetical protein
MAAASALVNSRPTVVTWLRVASVYVARSSRRQPTGASALRRSGSKASLQPLSGATATRVHVRSAPPGPAPSPCRVGGKSWSTGTLCQSSPAAAYTFREPAPSAPSPVSQLPVTAPPMSPSPSTTQAAAAAVRDRERPPTRRGRTVSSYVSGCANDTKGRSTLGGTGGGEGTVGRATGASAGSSAGMGRSRVVVSVARSSGTAVRRAGAGRPDSADTGGTSGNRAEAAGGGGITGVDRRSGRSSGNRRASCSRRDCASARGDHGASVSADAGDAPSLEKSKKSKDSGGNGTRGTRRTLGTAPSAESDGRGPSPSAGCSPRVAGGAETARSPTEGGCAGRGGA